MALSPGTRVGAYEVVAQIGAGGMGEVYRARDTKLNRDVALKILPEAFTLDGDRIARFRREAQVLASLNHPNIAAIYGFEDSGRTHALVLELVEGPTLADRIAKGPIPLDEALPIAKQIAEALEAAHEQGIIHRDLKPANIKIRDDGTVKVLDFGLAKAMEPASPSSLNLTNSPTLTSPAMMTGLGMMLGTAAYMSPEQAAGRPADQRSDLWAFGVVVLEMLTGRQVFAGETVSHVLASVLKDQPDWSALPKDTPPLIRRLLRRCLEKDRKRRLESAADAGLDVEEAMVVPDDTAPSAQRMATPQPRWRQLAIIAAVFVGAVGVTAMGAWGIVTIREQVPQPVRFTITPSAMQRLAIQGFSRDIAIARDGRFIVYQAGVQGGVANQLAVRALDELDARILPGINFARSPFFSPDNRWIGFFDGNGHLKKAPMQGGSEITLCSVFGGPGEASWASDDTIIFAVRDASSGLMSVSSGGGEVRMLTKPDKVHGEGNHLMPFVLPGGQAVLFTITASGQSIEKAQIAVLDLKTGQKKILLRGGSDARYVNTGHLVYAAAGTLRAVRFDLGRLEVTSDPVPVVESVEMSGATGTADFAVAQNGTLVYVPGGVGKLTRTLWWVNRQGHEEPIKVPLRAYLVPRISPDGTRVALDIRDQESDIWVWDLKRETMTRLTFDPGLDQYPVWTPDSRRIVFSSTRNGADNGSLFWQPADNTGTVERLTTGPNLQVPMSMSPDGRHLLFVEVAPKTNQDLVMLTLPSQTAGARQLIQALMQTTFRELNAEVSPDGRWVAYQSNESGSNQVYVRPFPEVEKGRWQVSTTGGTKPVWARAGRELFYEADGAMMAVTVRTDGTVFSSGSPARLFDRSAYYFGELGRTYDVAADGRFLMIKNGEQALANLVVVEHWFEELKERVPSK